MINVLVAVIIRALDLYDCLSFLVTLKTHAEFSVWY